MIDDFIYYIEVCQLATEHVVKRNLMKTCNLWAVPLCRKWVETDAPTNVYGLFCEVDLTPYYGSKNLTARQLPLAFQHHGRHIYNSWYLSWCKLLEEGRYLLKATDKKGKTTWHFRSAINEPSSVRRSLGWRYWNLCLSAKVIPFHAWCSAF